MKMNSSIIPSEAVFFYKQDIFLEIKSFEGPSITFLLLQQEITKNEMANIT